MNERLEPSGDQAGYGPAPKSPLASYGFATVAALAAVAGSQALAPLTDARSYVLLVGAVAVTAWYGGFRAGLLATAIGWTLGLAVFLADPVSGSTTREELVRWLVSLAVAMGVVWVSYVMRRGHEEAATAAEEAEASVEVTESLQQLASALSAAVTPADVVHALIAHTPRILGARGGAVAFIAGDELVVADPSGVASQTHRPGLVLPLGARAPIATSAATGVPVVVRGRAVLESVYPDGAALTPYARAAVAVPLRTAGAVVGSMSFLFDREDRVADDAEAVARIAADLGGQALERSRLFDQERHLRRRSERLQSMTAALSNALTRADVANVVVEAVLELARASGAAFAIVDDDRRFVRTLAWYGYPEDVVAPLLEVSLDLPTPGNRAIKRRRSAFYASLDEVRGEFPEAVGDLEPLGHTSFLVVPLVAGRRANGLLVTSWEEAYRLSDDERRFVESLASQAAQALDRAGHFESERTIAETLQRSVLPESLPRVDGVELAARYLPGTAELDVGGDWFDAIPLSDGRLGLVVGDVVGKGVQAAASMGQLRNALRAFSLDRMKPSSTIARLNRLADEALETAFATVVYAVVDPVGRVCRLTSAGHPPPLLARPDGVVELLEGGRGLPLGTAPDADYGQDVVELPTGSLVLLYTDGLVERRGRPIDEGLELLRAAVLEGPRDPERLVEHVLERLVGTGERGDDVALLAFRVHAVAPEPLELRVPRVQPSLLVVRDAIRAWLGGVRASRSDLDDIVLSTWEACANAVEHAREPTDERVDVTARVDDSGITLTVRDSGRWAPPSTRSDRGFGLQLMHALMSSVDIATGDGGTSVILRKSLSRSDR